MPFRTYNYEHRIVAFIDILGFAEKIKLTVSETKPAEAQEMLKSLSDALQLLQHGILQSIDDKELPIGTKASMFSDTIVVSVPKAESAGVLHLFELLKELQIKLIFKNILLRGGVVHGQLIHTESLILGPALVEAYNLESKSALYPRIVIDPRVLSLYARVNGELNRSYKLKDYDYHLTFESDLDGTSYVDYFNSVDNYVPKKDVPAYFRAMKGIIKSGTSRATKDIGIRMKHMWMKKKLESANYPIEIKNAK
jgi:hypothetical protein